MPELCQVCGTGPYTNMAWHEKGAEHQANLQRKSEEAEVLKLDPDLQAILDAVNKTPQERGQMVRRAFSKRDWPNEEHPGTVRDFMEDYNIPVIYLKAKA